MPIVTEINRIEDLDPYHLRWKSLWRQTRQATFFQSLEWLQSYWRHNGAGQQLKVLVVEAGGEDIGILPLVVRPEKTGLGSVKFLTYPLHDWGSYYGPIGSQPAATLKLGMEYIAATRRDWDVLDLRWVPRDLSDHGRTKHALGAAKLAASESAMSEPLLVEIQSDWAAYWATRNRQWRHNTSRQARRLAEQGSLSHVRYRPAGTALGEDDPRWDLFETCVDLAHKSWQNNSADGNTLCHPDVLPFLRDAHAAAARAGCLDLNLLSLDGRPIAYSYNYHCQGRVDALRMGFDSVAAPKGAGSTLMLHILKDSFGRGDECYNMGAGSGHYKKYWQTTVQPAFRYTHFPLTKGKAQALRLLRWLKALAPKKVLPAPAEQEKIPLAA